MKNLVIVAVIAVLVIAMFFVFSKGEAEKIFEEFGTAWARVRLNDAKPLMEGKEIEGTFRSKSVIEVSKFPMGVVGSVEFKDTAKVKNSDGSLDFNSNMTVFFNPPGVESAMTATMCAKIIFRATLKDSGNGWKVTGMDPELIEVINLAL